MDAKIALLKGVPLFADLTDRELEQVSGLCNEVDLPAGRALTREGDFGHEFFVIIEGRVEVDREGRHLTTLGPGDFLGEIALIDLGPRTATATCETDCRLLVLDRREFNSIMAASSTIQAAILRALARRVRRTAPEPAD
jgi:CRP-like cAMP-binding protein